MKRLEALTAITELTAELPVVAMCAATSRELAALADRPNHLYLLDSMGLTTSVGTGLALAIEGTAISHVVAVDGDGSLLMNLGALSTASFLMPESLVVVLLDNGVYASTAGLATHAERVNLGAIARGCGLRVLQAASASDLCTALAAALAERGPTLIHATVAPGNSPDIPLLLIDPVVHGARFRGWLTARLGG